MVEAGSTQDTTPLARTSGSRPRFPSTSAGGRDFYVLFILTRTFWTDFVRGWKGGGETERRIHWGLPTGLAIEPTIEVCVLDQN